METQNVAIYLDFENLAISAEEVYPSKDRPLLIGPIVDFAATKGNLCIKKAYADWSKEFFSQYQNRLMEHGFELIHLPATNSQGKNGSDVRLAIDVMENLELFQTINTLIIGSGDTDYIPLVQRIRSRGKEVIVIGFEHSVGNLIKVNSAEFKSLEELIGKPEEESLSSDLMQETNGRYGRELMIRYLKNKNDDEPVMMATLKQDLLRLDPSFSEKKLGFVSFKKYIQSLVGDLIEKIETTENSLLLVYFADLDPNMNTKVNVQEEAKHFLFKNIRYQRNHSKRQDISTMLFAEFRDSKELTMNQMVDRTHQQLKNVTKIDIRKYVNILFTGKAFKQFDKGQRRPLLSRAVKLKEMVNSPIVLEQIYINRVIDILKNRYPTLEDEEISQLLELK